MGGQCIVELVEQRRHPRLLHADFLRMAFVIEADANDFSGVGEKSPMGDIGLVEQGRLDLGIAAAGSDPGEAGGIPFTQQFLHRQSAPECRADEMPSVHR